METWKDVYFLKICIIRWEENRFFKLMGSEVCENLKKNVSIDLKIISDLFKNCPPILFRILL